MGNTAGQTSGLDTRQLIAVRAFEMQENQGRPHGYDLIHCSLAEQEIPNCLAQAARKDVQAARPKMERPKRARSIPRAGRHGQGQGSSTDVRS